MTTDDPLLLVSAMYEVDTGAVIFFD